MVSTPRQTALACFAIASLLMAGCGGGGDNNAGTSPFPTSGNGGNTAPRPIIPAPAPAPSTATLAPSAQLAQQCAPDNTLASPALRNGSLSIEKQWLRSYFDEAYLWNNEVPVVDANLPLFNRPGIQESLDNYFEALKTPALTANGTRKDKFSFTYPTAEWNQLSQSGVQAGFGIEWLVVSSTPPRLVRIAYIEPGSPAATVGLRRGDTLMSVNGVSVNDTTQAGIDALDAALAPSGTGTAVSFVFSRAGSNQPEVALTSASVTKTPVPARSVITTADGTRVGYIVFNDHIVTAEAQLIEAVNYLRSQNVTELVLDIRYNGGGYLYIASELAYMVAGPARTTNQLFEHLNYNTRRSAETNDASARTPFYNVSCIPDASFNCTLRETLPTLNLSRVYVLTQAGTCSASEAIINGLRGVNVDVRQIGRTTCGKPYGFTAQDNCGISYFPIEFKGINAQGFGDYPDGFTPAGTGATGPTAPPGCVVSDDLSHALGDVNETLLATALSHRATGACPVASTLERAQAVAPANTGRLLRHPVRENRLLAPIR